MDSFKQLNILPKIQKTLDLLGFKKPTEIQTKAIPLLLENPKSDVHAQAQTGTGKTLAFGIPLLHIIDPSKKEVQGLIIAPTRELVLQIYESLRDISRDLNISIEPIYGGMPINRQIDNIRRGSQIIVGTPGRLNDHLRRKTLSLKSLKVLILDEADIMLEMGFKEEIDSVLNNAPKDRQIWLFSATVMPGIKDLIKSHMTNVHTIKASGKGVVSIQVKQYYCIVPLRKRVEAIARFIESYPDFYGIIFCQTKLLTTEVTEQLASKGFRVNCLHGDIKQTLRNNVIRGFKEKDFNILVATDVASRGIDISNLTHVINYSIPREHENYVHRIGRTGRAGKEGIAISFIAPSETYQIRKLEKVANTTLQEIPVPPIDAIINTKMSAISDFIEQSKQPDSRLSDINKSLKELINSFSEEEIRNSFAISLEDKFFKDIVHEDLGSVNHDRTTIPQEICIELGQDTGLDEEYMRDYLYNTCKLLPQEITKVRVLKNKTFISIPENRLNECLNKIHEIPIIKQNYKAYLVKDEYRRPNSKSQSNRRFSNRRQRSRY